MPKKKRSDENVKRVVIDNGNGGTEGVKLMDSGRHVYVDFPSMRAEVVGEEFDDPFLKTLQNRFDYADWNGSRYTYGHYCLGVSGAVIDRHQGSSRYGNPVQQFLVDVAMAKMRLNNGDKVALTLLIPPGHFNEYAQVLRDRFTADEARQRSIQLREDKTIREFEIVSLDVRPELFGAMLCFSIDKRGRLIDSSVLEGRVYGLDGGMHTLDMMEMRHGVFSVDNLRNATIPNKGIYDMILSNVLREVRVISPHFDQLTQDHLDAVLRKGMQTGGLYSSSADWTLHYAVTVDLQPIFKKWASKYAEWIANRVIDERLNSLRGVDALVLFGGFAELVATPLKNWYSGDVVRVINEFDETEEVTPIRANMDGYARLSLLDPALLEDLTKGV